MGPNKTVRTGRSVADFIAGIADDRRRADAEAVCAVLRRVTGDEPAMWGDSVVGFGERHLVYATGRELDWFDVGFSPRKQHTTLYLGDEMSEFDSELARLGKHSVGRGCLYVKRLSDVDPTVLEQIVQRAVAVARGGQ
jgi:Domain of unknown function (DU1801)